ncbi:MAG: 6-phosphogluconolactonase [Sedimentisphaerales bacterium]|nr:6-phosphogluconolactonase [Sedimentisphaerales bacterium]
MAETADLAAERAASIVRAIFIEAITSQGFCNWAVCGGNTPRTTYKLLAERSVDDSIAWDKVRFFWGDERDVPADDQQSNYRMLKETLLDHLAIDHANVYPMPADTADIDAAAREYEQQIRQLLPTGNDGIPQFDLVMLGMGADGHTASLFPNLPILDETNRLVASCYVPTMKRRRMTFTFPLINAARHVLMLITGDDKAEVVRRVFTDNDQSLPAAKVNPRHGKLTIVLDNTAARVLES